MNQPALRLLEGLVLAQTDAQRRAFAAHHLGGTSPDLLLAVDRMQHIIAIVVEAARNPDVRSKLEMFAPVVEATGVLPESTLRSPMYSASTAEETLLSPQPNTIKTPPPDFSSIQIEIQEGGTASIVRSLLRHIVADVDETTLQGGSAPMKPSIMCRNLLRAGEYGKALDLYAALRAETETDPHRRHTLQVMFGLMNEGQRRQLDEQFETLFAEQPDLQNALEQRVTLLKGRLAELRGVPRPS